MNDDGAANRQQDGPNPVSTDGSSSQSSRRKLAGLGPESREVSTSKRKREDVDTGQCSGTGEDSRASPEAPSVTDSGNSSTVLKESISFVKLFLEELQKGKPVARKSEEYLKRKKERKREVNRESARRKRQRQKLERLELLKQCEVLDEEIDTLKEENKKLLSVYHAETIKRSMNMSQTAQLLTDQGSIGMNTKPPAVTRVAEQPNAQAQPKNHVIAQLIDLLTQAQEQRLQQEEERKKKEAQDQLQALLGLLPHAPPRGQTNFASTRQIDQSPSPLLRLLQSLSSGSQAPSRASSNLVAQQPPTGTGQRTLMDVLRLLPQQAASQPQQQHRPQVHPAPAASANAATATQARLDSDEVLRLLLAMSRSTNNDGGR